MWEKENNAIDELIQEGVIAGMDQLFIWDYTMDEIAFQIKCVRERELRKNKVLAQIAYSQAIVINNTLSGEVGEIYEYFPFWSDEERMKLKAEKLKQQFMAVAEEYNATN
ncbi:MAG: hypothetical protein KH355_03060 [Clostridiales bacterium]|nr:hypothetical protein [Clostridiales bacterium]